MTGAWKSHKILVGNNLGGVGGIKILQEFLGRTNSLLSFDKAWNAQKRKKLGRHTDTRRAR
jgi:hypothetical protein